MSFHHHQQHHGGVLVAPLLIILFTLLPLLVASSSHASSSSSSAQSDSNASKLRHSRLFKSALQHQSSTEQLTDLWTSLSNQGCKPFAESTSANHISCITAETSRSVLSRESTYKF